jgi:penicillin-binding protein 2
MGVITAGFVILISRLWYLQIVEGQEYADTSVTQKMHEERLEGPRGRIFARDPNVILADTRPARDVIIIPAECDAPQEVVGRLATILNVDGDGLLDEINAHLESKFINKGERLNGRMFRQSEKLMPYGQVYVKRDISRWELGRLYESIYALPGLHVMVRPQRYYLHGKTAGQLLGYLGEVNDRELAALAPDYKAGDVIGKAGLELLHEAKLHGSDGSVIVSRHASRFSRPQLSTDDIGTPSVAIDTRGRRLKEMFREDSIPGKPLHVTLDLELQQEAERLLASRLDAHPTVGSLVALNADTGEILAMASAPGYDPNAFVSNGRSDERIALLNDEMRPMEHRAYRNQYPPGSVFKIAMAITALEQGIISADTHILCQGSNYKNYGVRCWRWELGGHQSINVVDALSQSCDIFFYEVGLRMTEYTVGERTKWDVDRIHEWGKNFGLGVPTGVDLLGELSGLVPSMAWKRDSVGPGAERWEYDIYPAEIAMISIGQSYVEATPLQNAQLMAMVLNGGRRVIPYVNQDAAPDELSEPICSEATIALVQEGLRRCIEDEKTPSGTGTIARIEGLDVLGKTGSAQIVSRSVQEKYGEEENIPYRFRDHAWFVAGVFDREPKLAVCAMVEHGHHGNTAAGPLARELLRFFYERPSAPDDYARPITVAQGADAP